MPQSDRMPLILAGVMLAGVLAHLRAVTGIGVPDLYLMVLTGGAVLILYGAQRFETVRLTALAGSLTLLLTLLTSPVRLHPLMPGQPAMNAVQNLEKLLLGSRAFSNLFDGLYYYALDYEKYKFQEPHLFYALLAWGLSLAAWAVFRRPRHNRLKLFLPMVAMLAAWFQGYNIDTGFLLYFAGYTGYLFTSTGERGLSGLLLAGLSMLLGLGIYTAFPVENTIQMLDEHFGQVSWLRSEYSPFTGGNFRFSDTIYEPLDNRLGGPVTLRRDRLFSVRSDHGGHLYLRGRVLTHYDGSTWSAETGEMETFYLDEPAPRRGTGELRYDLEIFDFSLETKTLFAPLGVAGIDIPPGILRRDRYGIIYLDRPVAALEYGYRLATLEPMPSRLESGTEYFQLPEKYSDDVRTLTASITAGAANLNAKAEAIRQYLLSLTYSLNPSVPDADADFVEHFLFEEREGYCTYFASAMVVMSRTAGIPARYVEGFLTPYKSNADGDYIVTADRAHAWAELYLDGKWTVMEATPAYIAETASSDAESQGPFHVPDEAENPSERPEQMPEKDSEEVGHDTAAAGGFSGQWILRLAVVLCALAVSVFLRRWWVESHRALHPAVRLADDIMTLLVLKCGLSGWTVMTPREVIFKCAVHLSDPGSGITDLRQLAQWIEEAYYGGSVDERTTEALRQFRERLVKGERSWIRKWQSMYWIYLKGERLTWS